MKTAKLTREKSLSKKRKREQKEIETKERNLAKEEECISPKKLRRRRRREPERSSTVQSNANAAATSVTSKATTSSGNPKIENRNAFQHRITTALPTRMISSEVLEKYVSTDLECLNM